MRSYRHLLSALFGLLAALLAATPAAAWDEHASSHVAAPVAAFEHHHHAESGEVEVEDPAVPDNNRDAGDDSGHAHMPSGSSALADMLGCGSALMALAASPIMHFTFVERAHSSLGSEPQKRPPRFR